MKLTTDEAVTISLTINFSRLLASHNVLVSEFDVLNDGPSKGTHVVDDTGVLSWVTKSKLKRLLTDLEIRKNFHIDFAPISYFLLSPFKFLREKLNS